MDRTTSRNEISELKRECITIYLLSVCWRSLDLVPLFDPERQRSRPSSDARQLSISIASSIQFLIRSGHLLCWRLKKTKRISLRWPSPHMKRSDRTISFGIHRFMFASSSRLKMTFLKFHSAVKMDERQRLASINLKGF